MYEGVARDYTNELLVTLSIDREGVELAYIDDGATYPNRVPLVLIHGWVCDQAVFAPQIAHLRQHRRAIALDLRGHGGRRPLYRWPHSGPGIFHSQPDKHC